MQQRQQSPARPVAQRAPEISTDLTEQELLRRKDFLEFREEDVNNLVMIN
jgi:hypothetical protein